MEGNAFDDAAASPLELLSRKIKASRDMGEKDLTPADFLPMIAAIAVTRKKVSRAVAVLHCSIAALEGPEYLSRERRAEIGIQLRAMVTFIERLGGHLA